MDRKLTWNSNMQAIYSKGLQRLYFMRKLRQYHLDKPIMKLFNCSFVESILTFCFTAWYFSLSLVNKNKLIKIVNMSSKIGGQRMRCLTELCECRVAARGRAIHADQSHPLNGEYRLLPSGRRFRVPSLDVTRTQKTFVPYSIGLMNKGT